MQFFGQAGLWFDSSLFDFCKQACRFEFLRSCSLCKFVVFEKLQFVQVCSFCGLVWAYRFAIGFELFVQVCSFEMQF